MNRDEIRAEWKRATETFGAATTLARAGYNNDAVSRSYYAMLHAAKAGLATRGVETDSHRGVAAMFGKELVKTGEGGPELGRNLRRADAARQNADYQVRLEFTNDQTYRECERAHDFLTKLREQLKRSGLRDDELAEVPALPGGNAPVLAMSESQDAKPSWKDTVKKQFGIESDTPEIPPKAPAPPDAAAAAAQKRGQQQDRGPSK